MVTKTKSDTTSTAPFGDLGQMLAKFKLPGVDVGAIVDSQRKDMEALTEANREAYDGIKALAERRNAILMESLSQWQQALKNAGGKDAMTQQADLARKGIEKAMSDIRELVAMEAASRTKAWKIVQDRFNENLSNMKALLLPK